MCLILQTKYLGEESHNTGNLLGLQGEDAQLVCHEHGDVCLVTHLVAIQLSEPVPQPGGQVSLASVGGRVHAGKELEVLMPGDALIVHGLIYGDGALPLKRLNHRGRQGLVHDSLSQSPLVARSVRLSTLSYN